MDKKFSYYNNFYHNPHPVPMQKLLIEFNCSLLNTLLGKLHKKNGESINILEIGPGKGYFYEAVKRSKSDISYSALDSNLLMLESLGISSTYLSQLPELPKFSKKFDIVYAAFVIEHLKSGKEIYEVISKIKGSINNDGLIVFLFPDCLKQKMEFWNMDYTHMYPTTKRNVAMAFYENGINDINLTEVHGLLMHKFFTNKFVHALLGVLLFFYNYHFFSKLFWIVYRKPLYDLGNFFYRVYAFFKQENLILIAKLK